MKTNSDQIVNGHQNLPRASIFLKAMAPLACIFSLKKYMHIHVSLSNLPCKGWDKREI